MVRRHYREFELRDVRSDQQGGRPFVVADYTVDDKRSSLVTTLGTMADLVDSGDLLGSAIAKEMATRAPGVDAVVDLYLQWPDASQPVDVMFCSSSIS